MATRRKPAVGPPAGRAVADEDGAAGGGAAGGGAAAGGGFGGPPPGQAGAAAQGPPGLNKSLLWTYFLWFIGGWFGLHHWYLQRYRHMLLWMSSFGVCGLGVTRDLWRIPDYVAQANYEPDYQTRAGHLRALGVGWWPGWARLIGFFFFGGWYALWSYGLVPDEWWTRGPHLSRYWHFVAPVLAAVGSLQVLYVAPYTLSIRALGRRWRYLALTAAVMFWGSQQDGADGWIYVVFFVILLPFFARVYRTPQRPVRQGALRRAVILVGSILMCSSISGYVVLFNLPVQPHEGGEKIRLIDVLDQVMRSPLWGQFKEFVGEATAECWAHGYDHCRKKILKALDVEGEASACQELGVPEDADWGTIKKAWKQLSRQYHPDKNPDQTEEEKARYVRINIAYDTLGKLHRRRGQKSNKPDDDS